ncbi:MAG: DUF3179 domain-containing protein [Acidobacteriota bacterium]
MHTPRTGRFGVALACVVGLIAAPGGRSALAEAPRGYEAIERLLSPLPTVRARASAELAAARDAGLVPGIVDALFFVPKAQRGEAVQALRHLTGADAGERYLDWVDIVMRHPEWRGGDGYAAWKAALFARIDPCFGKLLASAPVRLRLEEVVFGGVGCEGIPSLDGPRHGPASAGGWLREEERVFGATLGGASRAYPESILSWHEMLNDELGGQAMTLSYCTLCGSAILFAGEVGGRRLTFGTSGLLYRSNKLMVDRATHTLWHNLTGEAVLGPLAERPERLRMLPLTATTWGDWRRRHPETTVLIPDRLVERALGFEYRPGAGGERRRGVRFPVGGSSTRLPESAEIYGLRNGAAAKAYLVSALVATGVVNDQIADLTLVVLADGASGAIRAYRRARHVFALDLNRRLLDERGEVWQMEESVLTGPDHEHLERLPGTLAFWRGWFGFFPHTDVYGQP